MYLRQGKIPEGNTDHCMVSCHLQDHTILSAFHSEVNHQISLMDEETMDWVENNTGYSYLQDILKV